MHPSTTLAPTVILGAITQYVYETVKEEERVKIAAQTGTIPPKEIKKDISAYDESRGKAEFVVEEARMEGGGHAGHSPGDIYPPGWRITARRLNNNGTYNPDGEIIKFYMTGCFTCMVEQVEIVRKMKNFFV